MNKVHVALHQTSFLGGGRRQREGEGGGRGEAEREREREGGGERERGGKREGNRIVLYKQALSAMHVLTSQGF